jgi:hypothetical protein
MTSPMSTTDRHVLEDAQNFSLVLGGPLFQFLRRIHLSDETLLLLRQRIIVISFPPCARIVVASFEVEPLRGENSTTT